MKSISIDLETRSSVDISKSGVYCYAEAEDFTILLFGYAIDGGETQVIDLANGEQIPQEILDALTDKSIIKWAFNANFQRVCLSRYLSDLGIDLDPFRDNHRLSKECARFLSPVSWRCTMVWSAYMALPLSLAAVGRVLGLEEQKMTEGKALIRYFSTPPFHEPTAISGNCSSPITGAMSKWRWRSRNVCPNILRHSRYGMNMCSTRRSMIAGYVWICRS